MKRSTEFYTQQMDQRHPWHKISPEQLDKLHDDCVKRTVEKFSASSEIQKPTSDHWKKILLKCKVEKLKEGYVIENETKSDPLQLTPAAVLIQAPSMTTLSHTKSSQLPGCNVGIYFGPDTTIFVARIPDGTALTHFEMKPYAAFVNGEAIYGEEALATPG